MTPVYAGYPAPPPPPEDAARVRGAALREARAVRMRQLRRKVISSAVALFAAVWLLIAVMLVTGHDPALASHSTSSGTSSQTTASSTQGSSTPTTSSSGSSSSSGATSSSGASGSNAASSSSNTSSGSSGSSGLTSVTTRAS